MSENLTGSQLSPQITRDYKIIRLLGKGGMGKVYLAEQLGVGSRRVALKVLNPSCSENPDLVKRFVNEAASAGKINHRNVVLIYESRATDDGQLYVAMEYVAGKDLRDVIAENGPLPIERIVGITRQICAGLGAAHKLGIVHRDVKPDNIMLSHDDDSEIVKVLDFGIARLSEPGSSSQTKSGVVMGTPDYMSPEQAMGNTGDKIDARSDIYSLGMVVYQMLVGRVAFESDSWMQVVYKHISEPPVPPSQLRPGLPYLSQIEPVILRALQKDREKRQQSALEFAQELEIAYQRFTSGGIEEMATAIYSPAGGSSLGSSSQNPTNPSSDRSIDRQDIHEAGTLMAEQGRPGTAASSSRPTEQMESAVTAPVITRPSPIGRRSLIALAVVAILVAGAVLLLTRPWEATVRRKTHRIPRGPMPATHTQYFTPVTLNDKGEIVEHGRSQTQSFVEELGSGVGLEMLAIPAGKFEMGASKSEEPDHPDEVPRHEVSVPAFYMARFETTLAEWNAVAELPKVNRDLKLDPSVFKGNPRLPVQSVSWLEAEEFCARLSRETGRTYRLPTEAEWEYACRAGSDTPFNLGDTITPDTVNYDSNYPYGAVAKQKARKEPVPVGSLAAANAFGLVEMHGNLSEWCLDGWHDDYKGAPNDGSEWQTGADTTYRVYRGGSWSSGGDDCRSAARHRYAPDIATTFLGFRVVMIRPK